MIRGAPAWVRSIALPVIASAAATALTWVLWPYIRPSASPLFFLAIMASSVYGGILAGLIATALAGLATAYLFMTPQFSLAIEAGEQRRLVEELRLANARIRTLSDMVPLCPDCRRVRVGDSDAGWKTVERYLVETPELQLTHALCPDCSARHFPEFHSGTM